VTDSEKKTLENLQGATPDFVKAVDSLYNMPKDFISNNFYRVFVTNNMNAAIKKLLNQSEQLPAPTFDEKLQLVYESYLPILKKKLRENAIIQQIAALIGLSEAVTAVLIKNDLLELSEKLLQSGFTGTYFKDTQFHNFGDERTESEINFKWSGAPTNLVPSDQFSVRWESLLTPPANADYTFVVEVQQADESFKLSLDDDELWHKAANDLQLSCEVEVSLNSSQMYRLKLEYIDKVQEAGIKLSWKTPTLGIQIIPSSVTFPISFINYFVTKTTLYHRAAKFISGFELNELELEHLIKFTTDFSNIDFNSLKKEYWIRINNYVRLRDALPQAQATLIEVFGQANKINPIPTLKVLEDLLNKATAWDTAAINYLVYSHFNLTIPAFRNEIALNKIHKVVQIVSKIGTSAQILNVWEEPENNLN